MLNQFQNFDFSAVVACHGAVNSLEGRTPATVVALSH